MPTAAATKTVRSICAALALIGAVSTDTASAVTFCVSTAAALQSALTTADANGEDDIIRVKVGTYSAEGLPAPFAYLTLESHDLSIIGGYDAIQGGGSCLPVGRAEETIITGQGVRRALSLGGATGTSGSISIANLTIASGHATGSGAGLAIGGAAGWSGNITVDRVYFRNSETEGLGGGLSAVADGGQINIRNSLFFNNRAGADYGVAALTANGSSVSRFVNNTAAYNSCTPSAPSTCDGGVRIGGSQRWILANSLFWNNDGSDWFAQTQWEIHNTNIQQFSGSTPGTGSSLNVANPGFVFEFDANFRLRGDSILRNAGSGAYYDSARDLDNQPRINDVAIDIGAYETQVVVFRDGFEEVL